MKEKFLTQKMVEHQEPDFLAVWDFCQRLYRFRCDICKEPFDKDILFDVLYDHHMAAHKRKKRVDTINHLIEDADTHLTDDTAGIYDLKCKPL